HASATGDCLCAGSLRHCRPAAFRRVCQRVPDRDHHLRPPAMAGPAARPGSAGRLRRPRAAPARHHPGRADRAGAPGRRVIGAYGYDPYARPFGRYLPAAAPGCLVPTCSPTPGMIAPRSLSEILAGRTVGADGYVRLAVDGDTWQQLAAGCAAGQHDLLAL